MRVILGVLCSIMSLYFCFLPFVSYAETKDYAIVLVCESDGECISGMEWKIYNLAYREENGETHIAEAFAEFPIVWNDSSSSALQETANLFEQEAIANQLNPLQEGVTDENGIIRFESLSEGIYLLSGTEKQIENICYTSSAGIVEISPNMESWEAYPKIEIMKTLSNTKTKETTETTGISTNSETNTGTNSISNTSNNNFSSGKLPQTGQLWWSVPLLGIGGICIFAFGKLLDRSKDDLS